MSEHKKLVPSFEETDDFDDFNDYPEEEPESQPHEEFMSVLKEINNKAQNEHNTQNNEIAIRAYQAAALSRIADGIQKHNELLEKILQNMQ